jgi:hypothetical protein
MTKTHAESLRFYSQHGPVTDPGGLADMLSGLPSDPLSLSRVVQGSMLHVFWAQRYGFELPEQRKQEVSLRTVSKMLARMRELAPGTPLTEPRPHENKLIGNCRDFSVMLCALLRHQGVPARARCGFATYFRPQAYEDHWICECVPPGYDRWVRVDAQLDGLQRKALGIAFDPCDMPPKGQFVPAGEAWLMCRRGEADPEKFGIFDMHGLWFIQGNLIRDFLALNRIEILPWDPWGMMDDGKGEPAERERTAKELDLLADMTFAGDEALPELWAVLARDPRLRVPEDWSP